MRQKLAELKGEIDDSTVMELNTALLEMDSFTRQKFGKDTVELSSASNHLDIIN
jgi:hypothetical protein